MSRRNKGLKIVRNPDYAKSRAKKWSVKEERNELRTQLFLHPTLLNQGELGGAA